MMGFQTKVILTFISMLSCVSTMTAGVVAILYQSNFSVNNNETIVMNTMVGDLYGYRFGAGYFDIYDRDDNGRMVPILLYQAGEVYNQTTYNNFTQSVGWGVGTEEKKIEYIFYYALDDLSEAITWITLTKSGVISSNTELPSVAYVDTYQYIVQKEEPFEEDWETAPEITQTLTVNKESRHIWIRACIEPRKQKLTIDNTEPNYGDKEFFDRCTWEFQLEFDSESA